MRVARVLAVGTMSLMVISGCSSTGQAGPSTAGPMSAASTAAATSSSASSAASSSASSLSGRPSTATKRPPARTSSPGPRTATSSRHPSSRRPAPVVTPHPAAPTVDPLTGGRVSDHPVIAVKIDNTYFGVRQFGVADADVVFVEQVEGGLTRLIAVFHTTLPTEVGPVRSVRSTDAQLLPVFGRPALVFAGGAGGPMSALRATSVVDTSALTADYFRSDVAYGTYNLHADLTKIAAAATGVAPARYVGFNFSATSPLVAASPAVSTIHLVMQSGGVDFSYRSGRFVRTRDGAEVFDYQGRSEEADNVLVQHVVDQPDGTVDSIGSPSYLSQTVGSGSVTLFRDGHAIPGTWKRAAPTDPFSYTDAAGHPLPFKPGRTWIALAPQSAQLTVS